MLSLQLANISESVRAGRDFALHCHSMSLSAPRLARSTFHGPGVIQFGTDRRLRFTFYSDALEEHTAPDTIQPGELIPDDLIHRLSAIDENENEWVSERVLSTLVQPDKRGKRAVVSGELSDIRSQCSIFPEGTTFKLSRVALIAHVFDSVDMPLNMATVTTIKVGDDEFPGGGAALNTARFDANEYKFSFTRHDDLLEIRVDGDTLAPGLEKRVIESLQFVLARPIWWTILCEERGGTTHSQLRSSPTHLTRESHHPPINSLDCHDKTKCVWPLFSRFFEYILSHDEHSWHPLSRFIYSVIEAYAAGFDTYRLVLGVAIEGILKTEFVGAHAPCEQFIRAVDALEKYLGDWKCEEFPDDGQRLRRRITHYFSALRRSSADDLLRALMGRGIITKDDFEAWKGLRHKTAHADRPDRLPTQRELDQVDAVATLMHKLVFQAIGYSGKYTDYGTRGFPIRDFIPAASATPLGP
jgi:hypothetical protein